MSGPFEASVESVEPLSPRAKALRFHILGGKTMPFRAGQHVQLLIPQPEGPARRGYFSIASSPRQADRFEICAGIVPGGRTSEFVDRLRAGDAVQAEGPGGKFGLAEPFERDMVFIAGGTGIAPLRAMVRDLLERGVERRLSLLFGNRAESDILYRKEWDALAESKPSSFRRLYTLSRPEAGWTGARGYVQDHLAEFVGDPAGKDFYLCGLVRMINGVKEKLRAMGVPEKHIHYERYD